MLEELKARLRPYPAYQKLKSLVRPEAPQSTVVPTDYGDGNLFIYAESGHERAVRTIPCAKEPDTIRWIEHFMRPGEVIFDIGANIGNYSLVIARHLNLDATVFAFEPVWFNFMQLNRNVALNGMNRCVFPLCVALSDRGGIEWLNYSSLEPGSSMHALGEAVRLRDQTFDPVLRQPVASFTLDQAVANLGCAPHHIKIDVDGIESRILAGARDTLANPALRSLLVELNAEDAEDKQAMQQVQDAGFEIWQVQEKPRVAATNFAAHANYTFVRK